jgi:hypothetical protein
MEFTDDVGEILDELLPANFSGSCVARPTAAALVVEKKAIPISQSEELG